VSLLHQAKGRTSEDLEGDKPPPAPDQDLKSNWIFQERVNYYYYYCQLVCIKHRASMCLESSLMGFLCIKAELFKVI